MKIGIIGPTSFIARNLCNYFTNENIFPNIEIITFGRKANPNLKIPFYYFDLEELETIQKEILKCNFIINCLAAGVQKGDTVSELKILEVNAFFPIKLTLLLKRESYTGLFITFGSYFELGNIKATRLLNENEFFNNKAVSKNHYIWSKRLLTEFMYSSNFDFCCHLILPNIWGYGEKGTRLIPYIVSCLKNNKQMNFSHGEQIRQFLHISDLCSAIKSVLIGKKRQTIYLIGSPHILKVKDLIQIIFKSFKDKYPIQNYDFGSLNIRDASMMYLALDDLAFRKNFNWKTKSNLIEKIREYDSK